VIAGQYRSRPLRSLRGMDIRPTSDRLRETLFNVLTAGNASAMEGLVWIDLFAGTGAVGIEALSRGAAKVYFVESSAAAARVIRQNLKSLLVTSGCEVIQDDAAKALRRLQAEGVVADFVFLDPPYRMERAYREVLQFLGKSAVVKAEGSVIAEHEKRFDPGDEFGGLKTARKLVQGDAALRFYRRV
jgi:16S rRNA (guanine(966)-N(2))-methyltransferase RsmD